MSRRHTKRERKYWPHSDPTEPTETVYSIDQIVAQAVDEHVALDGAQACVLGCRQRGQHLASCPCHDQCPDHQDHCKGCAPRPAVGDSLLCGSCFHRKIRSPLRLIPRVERWLFGQSVESLRSPSLQPRMSGSHEAPVPMNVDVHDHLAAMRLTVNAWADRVMREVTPADEGPESWQLHATCAYLERHGAWVSRQPWVATLAPDPPGDGLPCVTLAGSLRQALKVARGLAPWEQQRTGLPLPCTQCQQKTLALFGGDDWVTCTNPDCDNIIGWARYQRLVRQIVALHGS